MPGHAFNLHEESLDIVRGSLAVAWPAAISRSRALTQLAKLRGYDPVRRTATTYGYLHPMGRFGVLHRVLGGHEPCAGTIRIGTRSRRRRSRGAAVRVRFITTFDSHPGSVLYGDLALLRGLGIEGTEIGPEPGSDSQERGISGHRRTMHGRLERPKHGDRYSRRPDPPAVLSNTVAWRG